MAVAAGSGVSGRRGSEVDISNADKPDAVGRRNPREFCRRGIAWNDVLVDGMVATKCRCFLFGLPIIM